MMAIVRMMFVMYARSYGDAVNESERFRDSSESHCYPRRT